VELARAEHGAPFGERLGSGRQANGVRADQPGAVDGEDHLATAPWPQRPERAKVSTSRSTSCRRPTAVAYQPAPGEPPESDSDRSSSCPPRRTTRSSPTATAPVVRSVRRSGMRCTTSAGRATGYAACASPDGQLLAVGGTGTPSGTNGVISVYDVADRAAPRYLASLGDSDHALDRLAFSPDGALLATAGVKPGAPGGGGYIGLCRIGRSGPPRRGRTVRRAHQHAQRRALRRGHPPRHRVSR